MKKIERIIEILEKAGLVQLDGEPRTLLEYHILKGVFTQKFKDLENFLSRNPDILRAAEAICEIIDVSDKENAFAPLPTRADFPEQNNIPLGTINPLGEKFEVSIDDLHMHTNIFGRSGSGKTNKTIGLIRSANRETDAKITGFDPGNGLRGLLSENDSYKVLPPASICQNFFEPPTKKIKPKDWALIVSKIIPSATGLKVYSKNTLFDTIITLYKRHGVLDGSEDYPTAMDVFQELKRQQAYAEKSKSYQKMNSFNAILNRFQDLVNLESIFNVKRSLPIEHFINNNIIIETHGLDDTNYGLIATVIIAKIYNYRQCHNPDHTSLIIVDEARQLFSGRADKDYSQESDPYLTSLLTRSRAKKMGFVLITQEPSSISQIVKANAGILVLLSLYEGNEVASAARSLNLTKAQLDKFYELKTGQAVVRYCKYSRPFLLQIDHHPLNYIPTDAEVEAKAQEWFREIGYKPEIQTTPTIIKPPPPQNNPKQTGAESGKKPEPKSENQSISPDCIAMLRYVSKHPLTSFRNLISACEISADKGKVARQWLVKNGYANIYQDIKTSPRKCGLVFEPTEKAVKELKLKTLKGKGSFKHRCYQHLVTSYLESLGMKSKIEEYKNGKHIDVYCEDTDTAYEITLHFENLIENLQKDAAAGVKNFVIITEDASSQKKAEKLLKEHPEIEAKVDRIGNYFN